MAAFLRQVVQGVTCCGEFSDGTMQVGLHMCGERVLGRIPCCDLIQQPVGIAALGVNLEESGAEREWHGGKAG